MSDAEELNRLADLHQRGVLSDEEFARAKAKVLDGVPSGASQSHQGAYQGSYAGGAPGASGSAAANLVNGLRRSRSDRWLGGVCGGIAQSTGLAAWLWRVVFVGLVLCAGSGALLYLLLWIFLPEE